MLEAMVEFLIVIAILFVLLEAAIAAGCVELIALALPILLLVGFYSPAAGAAVGGREDQ